MKPLEYFYDNPSWGEGRFPQRFCTLFCAVVGLVFGLMFRHKAYDSDSVRELQKSGGLMIAGNHRSYLDPVFVMTVLRPRPIRYIAKEEFLQVHPLVARLAAWVGVFPVKRNSADMSAIKRAVRMLKRGEVVGMFPEGTRVRHQGQAVTYHEGIALIAQLAKVPVLPVRIWGADKISPAGSRGFRLPKVTLRFGKPLSIEEERFSSLPKEQRYTAFTQAVMEAVYALELPG